MDASTVTLSAIGVVNAVDAHLHTWSIDNLPPGIAAAGSVRPDLAKDYSPHKVAETAAQSGFSSVILVNACDPGEGNREEARFLVDACNLSTVVGCIIGVDLTDPVATRALITDLDSSFVRGARMVAPQDRGVGILSNDSAREASAILGEFGVRLDLLVRSSHPGQLQESVALVNWLAKNTNTIVVGNHLLKPTGIGCANPTNEWCAAIRDLAACDNFFMKISGMPGEVPPGTSVEQFFPFYDVALNTLGEDRLLFGSDHPVSYGHAESVSAVLAWLDSRKHLLTGLPQKIFGDNARSAYGL
jgi:L-fuconolactonase